MKKLLFLLSILVSVGLHAQKTAPKTTPKVKSLDEVYKNKHTLVSAKRDLQWGWEVTLKLNSPVNDDSICFFEVLRPDTTFYYASFLYREYLTVEKGQLLKRHMEITGDTIALTDRFAPMGTYKDLYPKDSLADGKASIMFLDASIPNSSNLGYFLPDFAVTSGSFQIGDTIELVDHLGRKSTGKIEWLDINCTAQGANMMSPISFAIPAFTVPDKFRLGLIYTKLSGEDVGEKITVRKIH